MDQNIKAKHHMVSNVRLWWNGLSLYARLGILFGIVMPVVSGLLFPTYIHHMPLKWQERARLLELHFVASEVIIIVWAFAKGMDRNQIWALLPTDIRIAVTLFLGVMFFSSGILATAPSDALFQSLIQVVHLYFFAAVYHLYSKQEREDGKTLILWLVAGLPVLILYTMWRFNFPPPPSELPPGGVEWDSALPGFISLRHLGTWIGAIAAGVSVHVLYRERFDRPRLMHFVLVFVLAYMFWTGTRAAVLGVLAALAICAISFRQLPGLGNMVGSACLAIAGFVLALVFQFDHPSFRFFNSEELADPNAFSSGRLELWAATIDRWLESPWVGWGTGSTFTDVFINWSHTQPHNAILQALISWGLLGGLAAIWLVVRAIAAATGVARADSEERKTWPLLAIAYCLLVQSMFEGPYYYPRLIILSLIVLATLVAQDARGREVAVPAASR